MDTTVIFTGLFLICFGFLAKYISKIVARLPSIRNNQKNVDIKGLTSYFRKAFIIMGLSIIVGYFLFKWIGYPKISDSMSLIVGLIGIPIVGIRSRKFNHK